VIFSTQIPQYRELTNTPEAGLIDAALYKNSFNRHEKINLILIKTLLKVYNIMMY